MAIRKGKGGRTLYCSGLMDTARLDDIFSHVIEPVGATINRATYRNEKSGEVTRKVLHLDIMSDNKKSAGLLLTDQSEINGVFSDMAGITRCKYAFRLNGRRVDAYFSSSEYLLGISAPLPEKNNNP
ncbi:MAG: hypothetical protein JXC85_00015 [Candidatus Aenigmarchaeota archaeon]|nr:hypothetical protein [Candidatus Aenigmarchaeota archaeon]